MEKRRIEVDDYLAKSLKGRAAAYEPRHRQSLIALAASLRDSDVTKDLDAHLSNSLVLSILWRGFDGIRSGISRGQIEDDIKEFHSTPSTALPSQLSHLLKNIGRLQADRGIKPPIFDYDAFLDRLQVVDSTFYFFLKHTDLKRLISDIFGLDHERSIILRK